MVYWTTSAKIVCIQLTTISHLLLLHPETRWRIASKLFVACISAVSTFGINFALTVSKILFEFIFGFLSEESNAFKFYLQLARFYPLTPFAVGYVNSVPEFTYPTRTSLAFKI